MEIWLSDNSEQKNAEIRLYAPESERIRLDFEPLKMSCESGWNPQWEEWHCYFEALIVYKQDYEKLLMPYFKKLYPIKDAISGNEEKYFDVCSSNWIGKKDWTRLISEIENNIDTFPDKERAFYIKFLEWIKKALEYTDIIVVEGNQ